MLKISLAAARKNAGYSQKKAAEKLNISNKTLSSWERGKSVPNIIQVNELCNLYNMSYDDINFLSENPI